MPSLDSELERIHREISAGQVSFRGDEFFDVLRQFASSIKRLHPGVDAWVDRGDVPNVFYLNVAPELRRFERNIMLSCWLLDDGLQCAGSKFSTAPKFEAYLLEFYKNPTFQESLHSFAVRSRADVYGVLRMSPVNIHATADEIFRVESAEFRKIAKSDAGAVVTIRAEKEHRVYGRARAFSHPEMTERLKQFRFFGLDGYGMAMTDVRHDSGEWYFLTGVVQEFGTVR